MARYQTEIVVASDRFVCLQLPDDYPEGRAVLVVYFPLSDDPARSESVAENEFDREDIEWWEEFDAEPGPRS